MLCVCERVQLVRRVPHMSMCALMLIFPSGRYSEAVSRNSEEMERYRLSDRPAGAAAPAELEPVPEVAPSGPLDRRARPKSTTLRLARTQLLSFMDTDRLFTRTPTGRMVPLNAVDGGKMICSTCRSVCVLVLLLLFLQQQQQD